MSDAPITCSFCEVARDAGDLPRRQHALPHTLVLSRTSVAVAWVGLGLAAVHPPHGLGVSICWIRATTGLPCWGCGLSRSLSCCLRGMFAEAWAYHPFGLLFVGVLSAIALWSILPATARRRVAQWLDRFPRAFKAAYAVLVTSFVVFGVARAMWHLTLNLS
jgi:hypothetical protein